MVDELIVLAARARPPAPGEIGQPDGHPPAREPQASPRPTCRLPMPNVNLASAFKRSSDSSSPISNRRNRTPSSLSRSTSSCALISLGLSGGGGLGAIF